jgi:hypothetical protein
MSLAPPARVAIQCDNDAHSTCLGQWCGHSCCSEVNPEYAQYLEKARALNASKQLRKHVQDAAQNYDDLPLDATTDSVVEFMLSVESEKEGEDYRGAAAVLSKKAKLTTMKEEAKKLSAHENPLSKDEWRTFAKNQCEAVSAQNGEFKSEINELLTNFAAMKPSESVTAVANRLERLTKIKTFTYDMLVLPHPADQDLLNGETLIKALTPELGKIAYADWMKLDPASRTFKEAKTKALQAEMVANRFSVKRSVLAFASDEEKKVAKTLGNSIVNEIQSLSSQIKGLLVQPVLACGICKSDKHYAKDCDTPPTCHLCLEIGHMQRYCPKNKNKIKQNDGPPSYASDDSDYIQYKRNRRKQDLNKQKYRSEKSRHQRYDSDDDEDNQFRAKKQRWRKEKFHKERTHGEKRKSRTKKRNNDSDDDKQAANRWAKKGEPRVCPRPECNGAKHFLKECPNFDGCRTCGARWHLRCTDGRLMKRFK